MSIQEEIQFTCKNCGETFRWEKDLSKHRRLDCKKKPYGCPECGQLLSRRDSLRQHLQRHDGGKKYSCKFCPKMFDQQQNLKVHLRIHSGERPYKCPECGRQFNQSQNLTTHLRVHSGEKPYVCKECGATFRFCSGYKSHMLRSHSDNPLKRSRKRRTVKESLPRQEKPPQQSKNLEVHRVSVIARVVSTPSRLGDLDRVQSVSLNAAIPRTVESSVIAETPSPLHAGLVTHSSKRTLPPLVSQFSFQKCDIQFSRKSEILQHMMVDHDFSQDNLVIKRETGNCSEIVSPSNVAKQVFNIS